MQSAANGFGAWGNVQSGGSDFLARHTDIQQSTSAGQGAEQVRVLPDSMDAARVARQWLAHDVAGVPDELAGDAILLTSELVSNATRYGRPEVLVSVRVAPTSLHVAVTDQASTMPVFPDRPAGVTQQSGRGLFLVVSLATAWGVTPHPSGSGKAVWFTLDGQR